MSNDNKIKKLLNTIKEKNNALGEKPKPYYVTHLLFPEISILDNNKPINLNTVNDIKKLVLLASKLILLHSNHIKACEYLDVDLNENDFTYSGHSFNDWINDFALRTRIIKWTNKKNELNVLKNKVKSMLSDEAKTTDELNNIENMIDSL